MVSNMSSKFILYIMLLIYCLTATNYGQISGAKNPIKIYEKTLSETINNEYAMINIYTLPPKAEIIIDDSLYGKAPLMKTVLPIGKHQIKIIHTECKPFNYDITLKHSEYVINVKLVSKFGYILFPDKTLEVMIDSEYVGVENKIKVGPGSREFMVFDKKDSSRVDQRYFVKANQEVTVILKKNQFTQKNLILSILLPGVGQLSEGAWREGLGFAVPFWTSFGLYLDQRNKYKSEYEIYQNRLINYSNLTEESELPQLENKVLESQKKLNDIVDKQKLFGWISIGIYILNLADVVIFHSFFDHLEFTPKPFKSYNNDIGYQVKIKYNF